MKTNTFAALAVSLFATSALTGCMADGPEDLEPESNEEPVAAFEGAVDVDADTFLDRPSNVKLRVAVWNTNRGSVFPKTDDLWKAINNAGALYDTTRTANAIEVFKAVNANVWLLQETVYPDEPLPSSITQNDVNNKIAGYMKNITGDSTWKVKCNLEGLCIMVRGNINIEDTCMADPRVNGYMLRLPAYNNASLAIANVHYKTLGQVADTVNMMTKSVASAKIVTGDFNNPVGGDRFQAIDGIPTLNPVGMQQVNDPGAIHLKASAANGTFENTFGSTNLTRNDNGHALVNSENGDRKDHFFFGFKENNWVVRKSLILNSLLLSKETLKKYDLSPLATAILPAQYTPFFSKFMTTGKIQPITDNDVSTTVLHDHLPVVVDLGFTNAPSKLTPKLVCP